MGFETVLLRPKPAYCGEAVLWDGTYVHAYHILEWVEDKGRGQRGRLTALDAPTLLGDERYVLEIYEPGKRSLWQHPKQWLVYDAMQMLAPFSFVDEIEMAKKYNMSGLI